MKKQLLTSALMLLITFVANDTQAKEMYKVALRK